MKILIYFCLFRYIDFNNFLDLTKKDTFYKQMNIYESGRLKMKATQLFDPLNMSFGY